MKKIPAYDIEETKAVNIHCVPKKRLPFEIKRQCRAFEFDFLTP